MRTRARAFRIAEGLYHRGLGALRVLHAGPWLGLLDAEDLEEITADHYRRSARYTSLDHSSSGLSHWEQAALARHFPRDGRILVLSAGAGREVAALARRGYAVAAYDCNADLVDSGNRFLEAQGLGSRIAPCAPSSVPADVGVGYDAALVGWSGYMHIPGRARRVAFLAAIRDALRGGAPVLVSFYLRSPASRADLWTARLASTVRTLRGRTGDPAQVGDHVRGAFEHHFTAEEIRGELEASGLRVAEICAEPLAWAVGVRATAGNRPGNDAMV